MIAPTTPILDDFNRANESPFSTSGSWGSLSLGFTGFLSSNRYTSSTTTGNYAGYYWEPFRINESEAGFRFGTAVTGLSIVLCRISNPGSTFTGYGLSSNSGGVSRIYAFDGGIAANRELAVATLSTAQRANDMFMIRAVGNVIQGWLYFDPAAGRSINRQDSGWIKKLEATDNTYTSGHIGMVSDQTTGMDDFFGGVPVFTNDDRIGVPIGGSGAR